MVKMFAKLFSFLVLLYKGIIREIYDTIRGKHKKGATTFDE